MRGERPWRSAGAAPYLLLLSTMAARTARAELLVRRALGHNGGAQEPTLSAGLFAGDVAGGDNAALLEVGGGAASAEGTCDMTAENGSVVCFSGRRAALLPAAAQQGLVGRWTFDGATAVDSSGSGHHGDGRALVHGPSPAGNGHSALFKGTFATVPDSPNLQLTNFSFALWAYFEDDEGGAGIARSSQWCPLLRKGVSSPTATESFSTPALLYSQLTGQLRVSVTTNWTSSLHSEYVDSNARLRPNRWVHLAIVHHGSKLLLYVNGILDAATKVAGAVQPNNYPLYIGGDPFSAEHCAHATYLDELRAYSRALVPHELRAEATLALGGADPSLVHLGCSHCGLMEAAKSCPSARHLCSSMELHTGAYQVAKSMGWLHGGKHVWTAAALAQLQAESQSHDGAPGAQAGQGIPASSEAPANGLGLCCDGPA